MATTALPIEALDHVALTVRDPQASLEWYERVLGFLPAAMEGLESGPPYILRVSPGCYLNLFPADSATPEPAPEQVMAFDYGPRCRSLFVSDPDGHQVELIGYGEGVFTA
jgi:catechol-2,3-dioxygenase